MATPAWTFDPSAQLRYGNQVMAATVALNNGDTSANLELGGYADVSLQFESLVGSPTLVVQASNDGSNWHSALDANGNAVSVTGAGIIQLGQITRYLRATCTAGTSGVVTYFGRQNKF